MNYKSKVLLQKDVTQKLQRTPVYKLDIQNFGKTETERKKTHKNLKHMEESLCVAERVLSLDIKNK